MTILQDVMQAYPALYGVTVRGKETDLGQLPKSFSTLAGTVELALGKSVWGRHAARGAGFIEQHAVQIRVKGGISP